MGGKRGKNDRRDPFAPDLSKGVGVEMA